MKKIKENKSLMEVLEWKEKVYHKIKNIEDKSEYFEKNTKEIIEKLGLEKVSIKKF